MPGFAKYKKREVICKNKPQKVTNYPTTVMLNYTIAKIKHCTKETEIYGDLLLHVVNMNLIATELSN